MKSFFAFIGLSLISITAFTQVTDAPGESKSTTFKDQPGIVVEISGSSARQLMLKLEADPELKPNGQIIKRGKNVYCVVEHLNSKCIIRFDNTGLAGEWQQQQ